MSYGNVHLSATFILLLPYVFLHQSFLTPQYCLPAPRLLPISLPQCNNKLLPIVSQPLISPVSSLKLFVWPSSNTISIISCLIQEPIRISKLYLLSPQSETSTNCLNTSSASQPFWDASLSSGPKKSSGALHKIPNSKYVLMKCLPQ